MNKAIFFDRDDTLIKDSGYMYKPDELEFFEDTFQVLKELQNKDFLLFIVTNQSGIGRGYFKEKDMHIFNDHLLTELKAHGINIKEIVFCPHAPEDQCDCRKPSPKLINQLCEKHDVDRALSWMVGDKSSDIEAGENAGLKTFNVKTSSLQKLLCKINDIQP